MLSLSTLTKSRPFPQIGPNGLSKHLALIGLGFCLIVSNSPALAQDLVLRDVTIVSPELAAARPDQDILILSGRIAAIGRDLANTAGVEEFDGAGQFVAPGLIDSHVHVWSNDGIREDLIDANIDLLRSYRSQEPRSYLYWGFTTLLDLTKGQQDVDRWNNLDVSPQLYACRAAPYAFGYGMGFQPEETQFDSPFYISDPTRQADMPAGHNPADHTPEAVVENIAKDGDAICVKTFHEPGFGGLFDFNTASVDVLSRVARAAEREGLTNFLHATSLASWRAGVEAGVPVMAHGLWHWDELNGALSEHPTKLPDAIEHLLDQAIEQGTIVQLTTAVIQGELSLYEPGFLRSEDLAHTLPPALIDWHAGPDGGWFRDIMDRRLTDNPDVVERFLGRAPTGETGETSRAALERVILVGRYLHENGGRLVLASDTPSSPTYTNAPGLHGAGEMRTMIQMGLTPREVLAAATIENARLLGLENEIGSVEVGKQADLLVLERDPFATVEAFATISHIILDGQLIDRPSLSALEE